MVVGKPTGREKSVYKVLRLRTSCITKLEEGKMAGGKNQEVRMGQREAAGM